MSGRKTRQSTLGELIVAVTDEVDPLMKNSASTSFLVSLILQDLFARRRVRLRKRLPPRGG